ncbi:MAG: hypothetical protein AAF629_32655, partial [Chloroflexota bacterium]
KKQINKQNGSSPETTEQNHLSTSDSLAVPKPMYDEPQPRWWIPVAVALLAIAALSGAGWLWLQGSFPTSLSVVSLPGTVTATVTATASPTATLPPTATAIPTQSSGSFLQISATETPEVVPGGQIVSLVSQFPNTGWLAEKKETDGLVSLLDAQQEFVHQAYLYAGTFDGQTYYGAFAFDVGLIPRGTRIVDAKINLMGLRDDQLGDSGEWYLELLPPEMDYRWGQITYQQIQQADPWISFETPLTVADLAAGAANTFEFNEEQLAILEERHLAGTGKISFRLRGPTDQGVNNLFAWDTGGGAAQRPYRLPKGPELVLHLGPLPAVTPTIERVLITSTPTPENIETAVANSKLLTAEATRIGTATPLPPNWITPIVVTATPTAENKATADVMAAEATAVALTTGQAVYVVTATPTPTFVVVTSTPTPQNLQTAAAITIQETANAEEFGRPTRVPRNWVTPIVVTSTPTPMNTATADAIRERVTLESIAYGKPTNTPANLYTATPTPTFVVVTSIPTAESIETAAAVSRQATVQAEELGTATPLPTNWVTPIVVTSTPTPANEATVTYYRLVYLTTGTPTPTPNNVHTATPTAVFTPASLVIIPTATATLTPIPNQIPTVLINKIVFLSDREGASEGERERANRLKVEPHIVPQPYFFDPETGEIGRLSDIWPYDLAVLRDAWSAEGRFYAFTADAVRYDDGRRTDAPAIYWYDSLYNVFEQATHFGVGMAYHGAWSPTSERIAFVATESGNDEIWWASRDGSEMRQMTRNEWAWDKHPSWSPNGEHIVFYSNRTGNNQIWVINRDGTEERLLMPAHGSNDWDPIWIKYRDPAPSRPLAVGGP